MLVFSYPRIKTFIELKRKVNNSSMLQAFELYSISPYILDDWKSRYIENNEKLINSIYVPWSNVLSQDSNSSTFKNILKAMIYRFQPVSEENISMVNLLAHDKKCVFNDTVTLKCYINEVHHDSLSFLRSDNFIILSDDFINKNLEFFSNRTVRFDLYYKIKNIKEIEKILSSLDITKVRLKFIDKIMSKIRFDLRIAKINEQYPILIGEHEVFINNVLNSAPNMVENRLIFKEYLSTRHLEFLYLTNQDFMESPIYEHIKNDWLISFLIKVGII